MCKSERGFWGRVCVCVCVSVCECVSVSECVCVPVDLSNNDSLVTRVKTINVQFSNCHIF